jgi:23S rRNA (guanine745-N1)-methyltransferase
MSNKSSAKRHGDDKLMVVARQEFLDAGHYDCLRDGLCDLALRLCGEEVTLLDAGCGEGFYTSALRTALEGSGRVCRAGGMDISREAVAAAARRDKQLTLAVAGINALPVPDGSTDLLLNIFAPEDEREFARVLRPGGLFFKAVPRERHLFGLKAAVYDKPYENPAPHYEPEGFEPVCAEDIDRTLVLKDSKYIKALFMMTPYYYKTGKADQEKLEKLCELETEISFRILVFRRKP